MSAQEHKIKVRAQYISLDEVSSLCLECSCGWEQCFDDTVDLETLLGAHKIEATATKKLLYEVVEAACKGEWLVVANDGPDSTLFYGSDAEKRAREYANFKNGDDNRKEPSPASPPTETGIWTQIEDYPCPRIVITSMVIGLSDVRPIDVGQDATEAEKKRAEAARYTRILTLAGTPISTRLPLEEVRRRLGESLRVQAYWGSLRRRSSPGHRSALGGEWCFGATEPHPGSEGSWRRCLVCGQVVEQTSV